MMQTNQKKRCIKSVALSNGSEGIIDGLIERQNSGGSCRDAGNVHYRVGVSLGSSSTRNAPLSETRSWIVAQVVYRTGRGLRQLERRPPCSAERPSRRCIDGISAEAAVGSRPGPSVKKAQHRYHATSLRGTSFTREPPRFGSVLPRFRSTRNGWVPPTPSFRVERGLGGWGEGCY